MKKKKYKLYKVEFNEYTNCMYDTVSKEINSEDTYDTEYLEIPEGGLIIKETEYDYYREYGHGFKTMTFVGTMYENE